MVPFFDGLKKANRTARQFISAGKLFRKAMYPVKLMLREKKNGAVSSAVLAIFPLPTNWLSVVPV
jgi:hypothetical protein